MEDPDKQLEQTLVTDDNTREIAGGESSGQPASWTYYAVGMALGMIIIDQFAAYLGARFFWSEQAAYFTSLGLRAIVLALGSQYWYGRYFTDAQTYVVNGLIALASGIVIAIILFGSSPVFWTLINLIVGPIDAVLLALLASRFILRIHSINKLNKTYG